MIDKYLSHVRVVITPQFIRYVAVGVCLNAGSYISYLLLTYRLMGSETAMTITFSIGTLLSFAANRRITFQHQGNQFKALLRFLISYTILYLFNFTALWVLADHLHIPHQVVQAGAIAVMTVLAFAMQRYWVFRATPLTMTECNKDQSMTIRIPFNKPALVGAELTYVEQAVAGGHASGDGPFTRRAQTILEQRFEAQRVLLTTSCTSALELAALLCNLQPGDEVIVPSYTFVSTVNAFALRGALPVFVDIRSDTLNIDEHLIEQAITPRTRAIFPVHYAGIGCEMDEIMAVANRHGLLVVEDAAQAVFSRYKHRWLGTIGHLGCYSFHETKNFSCGEGGALVINDPALEDRAEILREKGTNRSQFIRGQVDKYTWVDVGSSFLPSDILAAFLVGQLENMEKITRRRGEIFNKYFETLSPLAERGVLRLPVVPPHCTANFHMFYLLTADIEQRTALIEHLRAAGILAVFHYVPLHASPFARSLGLQDRHLPVTEDISSRLVRLPMYFDLTDSQVDEVARMIVDFYSSS